LLLGLVQWRMLRQIVRHCWGWMIVSAIAVLLGGLGGLIVGVIGYELKLSPGMSVMLSSLSAGLIYSLITHGNLKRLHQRELMPPQATKTGLDRPPDSKPWLYWGWQIMVLASLGVLLRIWTFVFPFPTQAASNSKSLITLWMPLILAVIAVCYLYLAILVHELGHLGFAVSQGFRIKAIAVSRVVLTWRINRWQFKFAGRPFAGGFVLPVSRSLESLDKQLFMMFLGGPVGSLLLAVVGILPWLLRYQVGTTVMAWFVGLLSMFSLHMAMLNLIPIQIGYAKTDGNRMLDLIQQNRQGQRLTAIYAYNASLAQGIRPRDIDPTIIDRALAIPETSSDHLTALVMAYHVELDKGVIPQAANYLDQALQMQSYWPEMFRATLLLEGAYFEAVVRDRADQARYWFNQVQETVMTNPFSLCRAEAAVLVVEGNTETALAKAEVGLNLAKAEQLMLGEAIAEAEWLGQIVEKITHQLPHS
jgi:Zn-dependent protease